MPKVSGIFEYFTNLEKVAVEDVLSRMKHQINSILVQNFVANRILYPQAIPVSETDLELDLAILRESLILDKIGYIGGRNNPAKEKISFIDEITHKLYIPESFIYRIPNISQLVWAFIDAYLLGRSQKNISESVWTIVRTGETTEILGTVLLPSFEHSDGVMDVSLDQRSVSITSGSLTVIPCTTNRCHLQYKMNGGSLLGKSEGMMEIVGGKLGLVIDGRIT